MKYGVAIVLLVFLGLGAGLFLLKAEDQEPPAPSSTAVDTSEHLAETEAERESAVEALAEAEARIRELEATVAEKESEVEELNQAAIEMAAVENAEEDAEGEEIEDSREASVEEILDQLRSSPQAKVQLQALTEAMYGDFINGVELDAETKAEVRRLLGESFMEATALSQYAMRNGEYSWQEVTEWQQQERDYLNSQLNDILPDDAKQAWEAYAANVDEHQLEGQLRNQIRLFASGLTDENYETVMQVAVEEFRAEQMALEQSDTLFNTTENIYYQFRAMDAMRERLEGFLPPDQFTEIDNFFTMANNLLSAQLPQEDATAQ